MFLLLFIVILIVLIIMYLLESVSDSIYFISCIILSYSVLFILYIMYYFVMFYILRVLWIYGTLNKLQLQLQLQCGPNYRNLLKDFGDEAKMEKHKL
jgi:hypothetical protein